MKPRLPSDHIDEQAAHWIMRLECGGLSEGEQAALASWIGSSAEHRQVFEEYRAISSLLDAHVEVHLGAAAEAARRARTVARKWRRGIAAVAAAAALVVAIVRVSQRPHEFSTGAAERHRFVLEDGSSVELNARSAVAAQFHRGERRIQLTRGEALFEVAKDPQRPFIVETNVGSVRALGTAFDVRSVGSERVEVTVLTGTVHIAHEGDRAGGQTATSDQQASITREGVSVRTLPEGGASDAIAWRDGQVVFDETPLSEVFERFGAYHRRDIIVESSAAGLRLGGRYSLTDLDGILDAIQRLLPVRVTTGAEGAIRIAAIGD